MGSLSNLYISQSYQSLTHFGNNSSASTTLTELEDGVGNGLGISLNTLGDLDVERQLIVHYGAEITGAVDINTTFSGSTQLFVNQSSVNNLIRITGSYTPTGNQASITEIGIGWLVNGGAVSNARVINVTGTPNSDVTYTINQPLTANNVSYSFTGSIQREVEIEGDLNVSDDLFVGGHLIIEDGVEITGSIDITGNVTASNALIENDLTVVGTINAYKLNVTIESSSVIFSSGSNILGDETSDTQTLIGSIIMSGSSSLTGSMGITGNISSSTVSGIGNVTTYSASVQSYINSVSSSISGTITTLSQSLDSRLDYLEGPFSTSVDLRLDELENWSSSLQTNFATQTELTQTRSLIEGEINATASFLQNQINQKLFTSSFNSYTASASSSLGNISASIAVTDDAQTTRINQLALFTGSYATSGSNTYIGNQIFSGSVRGVVIPLSVTSQTASMDLSLGNFFSLTLPTSSITYLNTTNIKPGETVQLLVKQQSPTGSLNYPSNILFATGSDYSASVFANSQDILSFVSFDTSSLYAVSIKNLV
jgi:hypothetical protein